MPNSSVVSAGGTDLTLTASLRPAALDARRGIVRLHAEVLAALGLRPGDPVTLTGRRTTAGIVAKAEPGASRALLYADDLMLGNLGVRDGAQVVVAPAPVVAARRVTLSGPRRAWSPRSARRCCGSRCWARWSRAGDDVSLLPQDVLPDAAARTLVEAARRSLANRVGYAWTSTLLTVVASEPAGGRAGHHGHRRRLAGRAGDPRLVAARPRPRPPPRRRSRRSVDDLPGLRDQAHQLTELLDLGFHHGDVLGRLGTTVSLGVLVPARPAPASPRSSGRSPRPSAPGSSRCGRRRWRR